MEDAEETVEQVTLRLRAALLKIEHGRDGVSIYDRNEAP